MPSHANRLLMRLQSLEKGDGLRRARTLARLLFVVGLVLAIFIGYAVEFRLHPSLVAIAAAGVGWAIAERNALRSRISQWPTFRNYIDWQRVQDDLNRNV
jgi:hypothetical protein